MEAIVMREVNLNKYRPVNSLSFSGRTQGESVRKQLNLDEADMCNDDVKIIIPSDTTSFNPSFFLGLLYDSISKLGIEGFKDKYKIEIETTNPILKNALYKNIEDALRNASNSMNRRSGLNIF